MRRTLLLLGTMMLALLLASGVAWAVNMVGTNGPDNLTGTNGDDNLIGNGGDDELVSLNGRDNLLGGPGKDCLLCVTEEEFHPFRGDKNLLGGPGNDFVWAGKGADNALGGEGNDHVSDDDDRVSQDTLSGGPGDDVIDVLQYRSPRDIALCGSGFDWVAANTNDVVASDCEKVVVFRGGTHEEYEDFWMSFYDKDVPDNFYKGMPPCHCRIFEYCGKIEEPSPQIHRPPPDVGV
jgi:Ca2+-binding RTX toxin-like protein